MIGNIIFFDKDRNVSQNIYKKNEKHQIFTIKMNNKKGCNALANLVVTTF